MIYLTNNTTTKAYSEANQLNTSGFYLWRVIDLETEEEVVTYLTPPSVSDRFCTFNIDVPTDLAISTIGNYKYIIYDGDGISTDFNTFDEIEVGRLKLEE